MPAIADRVAPHHVREPVLGQRDRELLVAGARLRVQELVQQLGHLLAQADAQRQVLERWQQRPLGGRAESVAAVARGVADVQHGVADRVVVELPELLRQLDAPGRDRARALERQVPLVAEVGLEQAGVLLATAGDDRLDGGRVATEAGVAGAAVRIAARRVRARAHHARLQRQRAPHRDVRSGHAGQTDGDGLEPPQVVAGAVEVVPVLGDLHEAFAVGTQLLERDRVQDTQRDVGSELVLAPVLVEPRRLHPVEIVTEALAGDEPLLQAVPVAELDERRVGLGQLELPRLLGALGDRIGQLIGLEVDGRHLADHPRVQLLVGVLGAELVVDGPGLGDLEIEVVELVLGDRDADLGGQDLAVERVAVLLGDVTLERPVVHATLVARDHARKSSRTIREPCEEL